MKNALLIVTLLILTSCGSDDSYVKDLNAQIAEMKKHEVYILSNAQVQLIVMDNDPRIQEPKSFPVTKDSFRRLFKELNITSARVTPTVYQSLVTELIPVAQTGRQFTLNMEQDGSFFTGNVMKDFQSEGYIFFGGLWYTNVRKGTVGIPLE